MKVTRQLIKEYRLNIDKKKLQIARVEKGWTITKLATESGVNRKTIGEIEKGSKKRLRYSTIEQIAITLGKHVEDFCSQFEVIDKEEVE
ncbi:helix-turn-helix transcriptional regulator [Priestia endophytica]